MAALEQSLELARKIVQADEETARRLARQELLTTFPLAARERQEIQQAKVALHLEAGRRLLDEGRRAEAAREFEAVLRLVPDHPAARADLEKSRAQGPR